MKMCHSKKVLHYGSQILVVFYFILGCTPNYQSAIAESRIKHVSNLVDHVELVWSIDNVYAMQNDFEPVVSASSDLVCLLGDVSFPPKNAVSCINSMSREIAWQKSTGAPAGIIVSNDEVFVTYYGAPGLEKYNANGDLLWGHPLTGVLYIYLFENQVQLFMIPERFLVLNNDDGTQIEELNGEDIIFSTANERFVKSLNFESRSIDLNQLHWSIEIGNKHLRLKPLFTENTVLFRTGQIMGSVYAVNKETGQVLWQTESNIIGNIAYLPQENQVVVLTRDGKLVAIDIQSG